MTRLNPPTVSTLTTLGLASAVLLAAAACNVAPTGAQVAIGPDGATTSDDLLATLTQQPTDENGDEPIIAYTWSVQGAEGGDFFDRTEFIGDSVPSTATAKGDTWRVVVNVTDGEEAAPESDPAEIVIANTPPAVTYARLSPNTGVDTFGTLVASGAATDIDNDPVDLDYVWYVDGVALDVDGTVLVGANFSKNQEVWVEVTASDDDADSEPVASEKVVILNTPPKLDGVVIEQEIVLENTDVTCAAVGWYDADDDAPAIDATWLVNGEEVTTDAVLTGEYFDKGDLIRCAGIPNDGDSLGQLYLSPVIQVGNTAPTIGGGTLSNTSPGALDVLTVSPVDAIDVDGDELSFRIEWYVNDEMVHEGDELPERSFGRGDSVWAVLTPFDGELWGEPATSNVATAVNTAPVISTVVLLPEDMYTDDVAFPEVIAEDVDGDTISYTVSWLVNGAAVSHTGTTLDGNVWFVKGDTLQVEVTPTDGEDDGAAVTSSEIEILNSPPVGAEVYFDPDKPKSTDSLTCVLDEPYFDADSDTLTHTFSWTVDGAEFTGAVDGVWTGDTIDVEDTADKQEWTCTLEVTDGDTTITSTATVQVLDWAGQRDFTTCGHSGYNGPSSSQCSSAYSGTPVEIDGLAVSGGIQTWTVPQDGTYRVEAFGAQGGAGGYSSYEGHSGARMRGDFDLSEGDKVRILVGQQGGTYRYGYGGGGGGGTFVVHEDGTVLVAAAGGGGIGFFYGPSSTCGGQSGRYPRAGSTSSSCFTSYRSAGYGGSYYYRSPYYYYGGGGAGYRGDGSHPVYSQRSRSFLYGSGLGGNGSYSDGGFGGGGTGGYRYYYSGRYGSGYYGGGGGGGYTGGSGGYYQGGGGASWNTGANQSNSSAAHSGHGKVGIDLAP